MMTNGSKYVSWIAFGIFTTIILFMFGGIFTMTGSMSNKISDIQSIVIRIDEKVKSMDTRIEKIEYLKEYNPNKGDVVNPYKQLEGNTSVLNEILNNLTKK